MRQKYVVFVLSLAVCIFSVGMLYSSHLADSYILGMLSGDSAEIMGKFLHLDMHNRDKPYSYGTIIHPVETPTPERSDVTVKAKLSECESRWPTLPIIYSNTLQPMSIRNARHAAVTMQMEPVDKKPRRWTIAPGATWKTSTHVGQRWLASDHERCLFYITAGDEPLRMVVNSAM